MKEEDSGPRSLFGIRIKTLIIFIVCAALLLVVINRSEIDSLLQQSGLDKALAPPAGIESTADSKNSGDIVVDRQMLEEAMQRVHLEKLAELESRDSTIPTNRFFYIVELHSGGDLEGIDLTIEPDQVILVSAGGTETKIGRAAIKDIKRFKLPPLEEQ
jgi:hypothetical protein